MKQIQKKVKKSLGKRRSQLKHACFTRGVNTCITQSTVKYTVQMSSIQPLYSHLAWLLLSQLKKKSSSFHCGWSKTFVTLAITGLFQKVGVAKVLQHPQSKLKVSVRQIRLKACVGKVSHQPRLKLKVRQALYK